MGVMKRAVKWTSTDVDTSTVDQVEKSRMVVMSEFKNTSFLLYKCRTSTVDVDATELFMVNINQTELFLVVDRQCFRKNVFLNSKKWKFFKILSKNVDCWRLMSTPLQFSRSTSTRLGFSSCRRWPDWAFHGRRWPDWGFPSGRWLTFITFF